jgi:hypothetical protein
MRCINGTLSLLNRSIKTKGPVNNLMKQKKNHMKVDNQLFRCNSNSDDRVRVLDEKRFRNWDQAYRDVIIYGFRNSSNWYFQTTPSNFLYDNQNMFRMLGSYIKKMPRMTTSQSGSYT